MNKQKTAVVSFFAFSLLLLSGCGEKTVRSGGTTVTDDDGELTVTSDTGETAVFTTDRLPENFPTDVPLYPGASILGSGLISGSANLSLQANKPAKDVVAWYKNELVDKSWNITSENTYDTTWLSAEKKNGSTIIITIGKDTEKNDPNMTLIGIIRSDAPASSNDKVHVGLEPVE